jgi:ABC-2 type transport system permease protein
MYNLIRADLFKLRRSMTIKILLLLTTGCSVAMALISYQIAHGNLGISMSGVNFLFSDINTISILGAVLAGVLICGDFDNKLIHDAIAGGSGRVAVIVSKAVTLFCAVVAILLPYAIVTGIALGTGSKFEVRIDMSGFMHIMSMNIGSTLSVSSVCKILAEMLTLIIVYVGQLSICVPLAIALKKPVLVVPIYYGISIACGQLQVAGSNNSVINRIFSLTPFKGKYFFLSLGTPSGDIVKAIVVSLLFTIVMLVVAYGVFRKSEVR